MFTLLYKRSDSSTEAHNMLFGTFSKHAGITWIIRFTKLVHTSAAAKWGTYFIPKDYNFYVKLSCKIEAVSQVVLDPMV